MAHRARLAVVFALLPATALAQQALFVDDFRRADGTALGPAWAEYQLRGDQAPRPADTPWSIRGNTLTWTATGSGAYVEDFIATAQALPVDGTRVEFELRATVGTAAGYVGPGVLWLDEPARKRGAFNLSPGGPGWLGLGLFYRWENRGTGGALLYAGGGGPAWQDADRQVPGVNQGRFVRHALTVKDGVVTWEADGAVIARVPLAEPLPAGARRRLLLTTRLYDSGLAQSVEIRNLRITGAADGAPATTPPRPTAPPEDTFVEANAPASRVGLALAFTGPKLTIEAAPSLADLANDRSHWRLSTRAAARGTYPAAVSFNAGPEQALLSTPPCTVTLTRLEGPGGLVEGRFDCALQAFDGERPGAKVRSTGSFRARVEP